MIIDPVVFESLKATMGEDFVGELVDIYFSETADLIEKLKIAMEEEDANSFRRAAHSIKSSSASMGALEFSAQARSLEEIGKSGELKRAEGELIEFINTYPGVVLALKELV